MSESGYGVHDDEFEIERARLDVLAQARDPKTIQLLERCGVASGWHCLEVGAGAGSISIWLAEQVGEHGRVMSTDVDLRFHREPPANMILREHDISADKLPAAHFDLVHARAVLQHLPERQAVIDRLLDALKPGGWLVLEDGDFGLFESQPLPEPYASVHSLIAGGATTPWRDPHFGGTLLAAFRDRGLRDIDLAGDLWAMRPGEPGGEWWFLAVERTGPRLVAADLVSQDDLDRALEQIRAPGFVMMSTTSIAVLGRKP
jgi:SAM-dependent methyltransferase